MTDNWYKIKAWTITPADNELFKADNATDALKVAEEWIKDNFNVDDFYCGILTSENGERVAMFKNGRWEWEPQLS